MKYTQFDCFLNEVEKKKNYYRLKVCTSLGYDKKNEAYINQYITVFVFDEKEMLDEFKKGDRLMVNGRITKIEVNGKYVNETVVSHGTDICFHEKESSGDDSRETDKRTKTTTTKVKEETKEKEYDDIPF